MSVVDAELTAKIEAVNFDCGNVILKDAVDPSNHRCLSEGSVVDVEFSHVEDNVSVYVNPMYLEKDISWLSDKLDKFYGSNRFVSDVTQATSGDEPTIPDSRPIPINKCKLSMLHKTAGSDPMQSKPILYCAAKYETDDAFYRAQLLERTSASRVKVFFIDYGNIGTVTVHDVFELHDQFRRFHPMCFRVTLDTLLPAEPDKEWLVGGVGEFDWVLYVSKVIDGGGGGGGRVGGRLVGIKDGKEEDLNTILLRKHAMMSAGAAQPVVE